MLHSNYVGVTLHAFKMRPDKGYKLICDLLKDLINYYFQI